MAVEKDMVVTLEYTITSEKGELIESSFGRGAPIKFILGRSGLLPGIDAKLIGIQVDQEVEFDLPPEEAFGTEDSGPTKTVPKKEFPEDAKFGVGTRFQAEMPEAGGTVTFVIVEDRLNDVMVRFVHPLAGKTIHVKARVIEAREATPEELESGNVEQDQ